MGIKNKNLSFHYSASPYNNATPKHTYHILLNHCNAACRSGAQGTGVS